MITAPLIKEYSHSNVEEKMEFSLYSSEEMQYSVQYPKHWSAFQQSDANSSKKVVFRPPPSESGIQELSVVSTDSGYHV